MKAVIVHLTGEQLVVIGLEIHPDKDQIRLIPGYVGKRSELPAIENKGLVKEVIFLEGENEMIVYKDRGLTTYSGLELATLAELLMRDEIAKTGIVVGQFPPKNSGLM